MVRQLGVGHIDLAGNRVHYQVEENGSDMVILYNRVGCQRIGVYGEDIVVGQLKAHAVAPVGAVAVDPIAAIVFHDHAGLGSGISFCVIARPRYTIAAKSIVDLRFIDCSGLVARLMRRHVDGTAVRCDCETTRCVGEETLDFDRRATNSCSEGGCVEHPDISTANTLC